VVIWDRSWYNRAGVERVMGFCSEEEARRFLEVIPSFEKLMVDSGIVLIKYWLEVSMEEQTRRLKGRIDDGRKIWKLSPMDLRSYGRWYDYSRARDEMFKATDTKWAPWHVVRSDDKRRARLNLITHLLKQVKYKEAPREKVKLPKRGKPRGYKETKYPFKFIQASGRSAAGPTPEIAHCRPRNAAAAHRFPCPTGCARTGRSGYGSTSSPA
jgi:hypothetical protein